MTKRRNGIVKLAFSFAAIITLAYSSAYSQEASSTASPSGNIKGRVLKKDGGDPLADAKVQIHGLDKATSTDKDGKYEFNALEADKDYSLEVSRILYKDDSTTVNVRPNKTVEASDVKLDYEGINARAIQDLGSYYTAGDLTRFGIKLDVLSTMCAKVKEKDCKAVAKTNRAFDRGDFKSTKSALEKLEQIKAPKM